MIRIGSPVVARCHAMRCVSAIVLAGIVGCGSAKGDRAAVSGHVTYDGAPLQSGQIVFEPVGQGRMAIAQIVDGQYAIAAERGPTVGDYVVRITASRPTGEMASAGATGGDELRPVYEQYLPSKYNDQSELSIKIDAVSVVEHDFELHS